MFHTLFLVMIPWDHGIFIVNCFEKKLSTVMCEAKSIKVLSLNGLGAAEGCHNTVKFPMSDVSLFNTIGGTLPECLWYLEKLVVLHLTGNGLTGTLVTQLPLNSQIVDLSLSHNKFSGEIPLDLQKIPNVELSFNQLSGRYEDYSEQWLNNQLDLEINRLSGQLPKSKFENVSNLKILRGNMFSCDSIPENDDFAIDYICGSEDLDESLVVFGSALSLTFCAGLVVCLAALVSSEQVMSKSMFPMPRLQAHINRLRVYMTHADRSDVLQPIVDLCRQMKTFSWHFFQLCLVILVTGASIYILRATDDNSVYSTHANTYAWSCTLAYLRGAVPAALILMSWIVTIGACFYRIILGPLMGSIPVVDSNKSISQNSIHRCGAKLRSGGSDEDLQNTPLAEAKKRSWIVAALLMNAAVTIFVNVLYIKATQQQLSALLIFGIQLSLAVFKLVYSYCAFPLLSASIHDPLSNIGFRLRLLIMNNLVIPCIVTAFASPSCFQVCYK
jgi:hypothetical protein